MKANYDTKTEKANGSINLSLYDLNKQIISQLPEMDDEKIQKAKETITEYVGSRKYFMLLGRELNYYTLFSRTPSTELPTIADEVIDCLRYVGTPKGVDLTEDGSAIEMWITNEEGESFLLMFFDYTEGVIVCQ